MTKQFTLTIQSGKNRFGEQEGFDSISSSELPKFRMPIQKQYLIFSLYLKLIM